MLPRLLALLCLTAAMLLGMKLAGDASGWWPGLPTTLSMGLLLAAWMAGSLALITGGLRRAAVPAPPPVVPAPTPAPAAPRARLERRAHPRVAVDWPVRAEWRDGRATAGILRDISRGGAQLATEEAVPAGMEGVLHIAGIALPVPARVVEARAGAGLHLAFEIEGLAFDAFLAQLDRQLEAQAKLRR